MIEKLRLQDWKKYVNLLSQLSNFKCETTYTDFCRKFNNIPPDSVYVIKNGEKIIATARLVLIYKIHDHVALIEDVVVDKNYRRQGLGTQLVKYILERAKELGCYKIVTMTAERNQSFYESCGMSVSGIALTNFV